MIDDILKIEFVRELCPECGKMWIVECGRESHSKCKCNTWRYAISMEPEGTLFVWNVKEIDAEG